MMSSCKALCLSIIVVLVHKFQPLRSLKVGHVTVAPPDLPLPPQTQTYVKVYNLAKQELAKKLQSGVKWISSIDIHPWGERHYIIITPYNHITSKFKVHSLY